MKRFISLVLVFTMLCGCMGCLAYAEEEIAPYNSAYFISYGTTLSKAGGGKIKITFQACATGVATTLGVSNYQIERLNSKGEWIDCTGMREGSTASKVGTYTFSKIFYGIPGETYRVKVTFLCAMNGGAENKSYTSGQITAK